MTASHSPLSFELAYDLVKNKQLKANTTIRNNDFPSQTRTMKTSAYKFMQQIYFKHRH